MDEKSKTPRTLFSNIKNSLSRSQNSRLPLLFFSHFFATPFRSIILGCKGWAFRWLTTKLPHFEQRVLRSRLIFGLALRYTTPRIDFPQPTEETTPNWQQYKIKSQYSAKALGAGAVSGGSVVHSVEYAGVGAAMLTAPGAGVG